MTLAPTEAAPNTSTSAGGSSSNNTPAPTRGPNTTVTPTNTPTNTPTGTTEAPTDTPTDTPTPIPQYTVSFDSNGGSSVPDMVCSAGDTLGNLAEPTRTNYTFDGWKYGNTIVGPSTVVNSDMTLVAQWTMIQYTVTFDPNGGTSVSSRTVDAGSSIGSLPPTTREGYTFAGWTYNGSTVSSSTTVNSDMTIVAQWTPRYTVTFNTNGGSAVDSITVDEGTSITLPTTSRTYYTFRCWVNSNGSSLDQTISVNSNMSLTADWTENGFGDYSAWSTTSISEEYDGSLLIRQVETRVTPGSPIYEYQYSRYDSDPGNYGGYSIWSGPSEGYWSGIYCYILRVTGSSTPFTTSDNYRYYSPSGETWYNQAYVQIGSTPDVTEYRYRTRIP